jgi:hypothetical protein
VKASPVKPADKPDIVCVLTGNPGHGGSALE